MPLSNPTLPTSLMEYSRSIPFDNATAFAQNQTLTATGYLNNIQTQVDIGPGRFTGYLVLELSALDLSSLDETYRLYLLGSNDSTWTNGNIDTLATQDFAATTAGRMVPTICPASNAVPGTGQNSNRFMVPFTNQRGKFIFRYMQLYAVLGGTTPSITGNAWISADLDR